MEKKFSDGKIGAALTIRVTPRADSNEFVEFLSDQTIKVRLTCSPNDEEINTSLIDFLSESLSIPKNRMEIVAGTGGRDKLVSILDLEAITLQEKIASLIS